MMVEHILQALSLDVSVLEHLLERHRNSHGRTVYFRRISMTLIAIRRHKLFEFGSQFESLERCANHWIQSQKRKKERNEEEQWSMKRGVTDEEEQSLKKEFSRVERMLIEYFPELLSRIRHASSALFMEVNRGFFLPFCMVALSALARIRTLIIRWGRSSLVQLRNLMVQSSSERRDFLSLSDKTFENTIVQFSSKSTVEDEKNMGKQFRDQVLASLGLSNPGRQELLGTPKIEETAIETIGDDTKEKSKVNSITESERGLDRIPSEMISSSDDKEDDVGESITISTDPLPSSNGLYNKKDEKAEYNIKSSPLDTNMSLVEHFQQKGSDDKNKKKSKKRKESNGGSIKEKKKKKKKKAKKDFFDDLFD